MKRLAITRTVIPLDYDKSIEGFNSWAISVRNQVHVSDRPLSMETIVNETNKILKFHKSTKK